MSNAPKGFSLGWAQTRALAANTFRESVRSRGWFSWRATISPGGGLSPAFQPERLMSQNLTSPLKSFSSEPWLTTRP